MIIEILGKISRIINHKIDISDDYIEWLCFANPGMLNRGNLYSFNYAIEHLPSDSPILEIGSFCGLSTNIINYYLGKNNKKNKLFTCDKWIFEGAEHGGFLAGSNINHADYREFVKNTYKRNVSFFSKNNLPFTIESFSNEFFERWGRREIAQDVFDREIKLGGSISFCYIDGNHSYEFVKNDFINTDRFLEPGGFILFDDSSDRQRLGSSRFTKELMANDKYELVIKNPNYLFRKALVA